MSSLSKDKLTIISILISMIALLLLSLVVWIHLSTQDKVEELEYKLKNMQQMFEHSDHLQAEFIQIREHIRRIEDELRRIESIKKTAAKPVVTPAIKIITPKTPIQAIEQKKISKTSRNPTPTRHWTVIIASFDRLEKAKHVQQDKRIRDLQNSIAMITFKHKTWYRIVHTGFKDKASAIIFSKKVKRLGFRDAWIQHQP